MLNQQTQKIKRTIQIVQILIKYGFEDLALRSGLSVNSSDGSKKSDLIDSKKLRSEDLFERIRKVLEELGGTFVKFGQAFSAREDLLPKGLILELKKLQDRVPPDDLKVLDALKQQLGINIEEAFLEVDETPLASASISQVYKAKLLDGTEVVLKYKRPGIRVSIETDLLILKDLVKVLSYYSETLRKINLEQILLAFSNAIIEELSFLNEQKNITRFNQNFEGNKDLYKAKSYPQYSTDDLLCMDFVAGAKITDVITLKKWHLDADLVVKRGLNLFLTQVIDHGFFHADPHAGNLMVMPSGQIAFIDMGSMGTLIPPDKELLEDFVINFIQKDAKRLRITIQKMAIRFRMEHPEDLENDLKEIFYLLDNTSLEHLDVKDFFTRFSGILNRNEILMPEHIYLLVRGVALIEGIGRELSPGLNIMDEIRPFVHRTMMKRLKPEYLLKKAFEELRDFQDIAKMLPRELSLALQKINAGELTFKSATNSDQDLKLFRSKMIKIIGLGIILMTSWLTSGLFTMANYNPKTSGIPNLAWFCFALGVFSMMGIFYQLFMRRR